MIVVVEIMSTDNTTPTKHHMLVRNGDKKSSVKVFSKIRTSKFREMRHLSGIQAFSLAKICVSTGLPFVVRCEAADALRLDLYKSRGGGAG
jgi:hypothetical protein